MLAERGYQDLLVLDDGAGNELALQWAATTKRAGSRSTKPRRRSWTDRASEAHETNPHPDTGQIALKNSTAPMRSATRSRSY